MAEQRPSLFQRIFGGGAEKNSEPSVIPDFEISPYARGAVSTGQLQKRSVSQLRRWSRSNPWLRAAINLRRTQISRAKWDIVSADWVGEAANEIESNRVKLLLRNPNQRGDSWRSFIEPIVEDILVLDQGAIEIEMKRGARLKPGSMVDPIANLWPKDAGLISFDAKWDGTKPNQPRYYEHTADTGELVASYKNDEMVVIMANPVTYSPIGLSPLEVLADTIEADLAAADYNSKTVKQAVPPGILNLGEGIRADQVDSFKAYWEAEIAGKSQIAITGGAKGIQWMPLAASNRDMQFMEWQVYLARKICAVFGVQPQDIGISFDVNRSTAEVGAGFTQDVGIAPLLDLIAEYITREIVWRYDRKLKFSFTDVGRASMETISGYYKAAMAGMPWMRLNEALKERGMEGVGELGDDVWLPTPQGYMPLSLYEIELRRRVLGENPLPEPTSPGGGAPAGGEGGGPTPPQTPPAKMKPAPTGAQMVNPTNNPEMAPNQQPSKAKKSAGDPVIVCDIDGTLDMGGGKLNEAVAEHLRTESMDHDIYILSARNIKRMDETKKFLESNDIPHSEIFLSDFPSGTELQWKKYKMSKILGNRNVVEAIDNNGGVRDEYKKLGIDKVTNPDNVKLDKSAANLDVPESVKKEAQRGLDWRKEFGRGGIGPGQTTARMLIGNRMTAPRVRKMNAYFARHEVDKKGKGWAPGSDGYPSNGKIAWALWGGDAGWSWSGKVVRQLDNE